MLRRLLAPLLLACASLALAFSLGEALLYWMDFRFDLTPERVEFGWPDPKTYRDLYVPDPDLYWVPRNYLGTLATLEQMQRPLVFIGDSVTDLCGYVEAFGAKLRAAGVRSPGVIKLGVGGWTSHEGLAQLRRDVVPQHPALVSIFFGWNDHWIGYGVEDRELDEIRLTRSPLLARSRVIQLLTKARLALRLGHGRKPVRVTPDDFRANLVAMVRETRAAGAVPLLLTAPTSHRRGEEPAYLAGRWIEDLSQLIPLHERYVGIVRDVAAAERAPLCDLYARVNALPHERVRDELFFDDGIHLRPAGDQQIADLLLDCFHELPELRALIAAAR